jgi:hypothetical protein
MREPQPLERIHDLHRLDDLVGDGLEIRLAPTCCRRASAAEMTGTGG